MKYLLSLALIFTISLPAFAKKKRRSKKSQVAIVQVDGAAVYKVPNFDSPIIAYLNKGKKIRASKKKYPGIGGLGSFYKVRLKKKKYGYVTDVDLFPSNKKNTDQNGGGNIFVPTGGDDHSGQAMGGSGRAIFLKRYIGLSYNLVNYKEEIAKTEYTESIGFFGLKVSGPGALFVDLPLELNILGFFGSPTYYTDLFNEASGFIIIADVLYTLPLIAKENYMLYVGVGPSIRYSSQQVEATKLSNSTSTPFDIQFANLGGALAAGFAFQLGESFAIKAEGKYMMDEQSQIIYGGALQFAF